MNAWIQSMGLDTLKPALTALLLPPVPWLLLILLGALCLRRGPRLGWLLVLAGVGLIFAGSTPAGSLLATRWLLDPAPPLRDPARIVAARGAPPSLIVVLGGGRTAAAEYHEVSLSLISMERLRYGIWLSRESGVPVAFSGGLAPGNDGPSEGSIAERIAREEFRHPLRWVEDASRDTHENALATMVMLRQQPGPAIGRLVLVTHDLHMTRALRHFQRARDTAGLQFDIVPAPVGITEHGPYSRITDYLPAPEAITRTRYAFREWLGLLAGA